MPDRSLVVSSAGATSADIGLTLAGWVDTCGVESGLVNIIDAIVGWRTRCYSFLQKLGAGSQKEASNAEFNEQHARFLGSRECSRQPCNNPVRTRITRPPRYSAMAVILLSRYLVVTYSSIITGIQQSHGTVVSRDRMPRHTLSYTQ